MASGMISLIDCHRKPAPTMRHPASDCLCTTHHRETFCNTGVRRDSVKGEYKISDEDGDNADLLALFEGDEEILWRRTGRNGKKGQEETRRAVEEMKKGQEEM
ncbi:hypothetical protein AVEN_245597-1 [Araneus ventricosus]|uniref:Uncharacterized protein n=1 Tax=Araneus ventricosus TaxID=182803 RepID=A0A4Y2ISQ5_ARAVE|nr:hypothetical protein AVEN_245597-1 [Araneus ventricosus]